VRVDSYDGMDDVSGFRRLLSDCVVDMLSSDVVGESLGFNVLLSNTIFGRFLGIRSPDHHPAWHTTVSREAQQALGILFDKPSGRLMSTFAG
jgi:hypothetical protein